MSVLTGWWRRRGHPERIDLYTRASLYFVAANELLLAVSLLQPGRAPGSVWPVVGIAAAHAVLCMLLVRTGLRHYLGDGPRPIALIAVTGAVGALGVVAGIALMSGIPGDEQILAVLCVFVIPFVGVLSLTVPLWIAYASTVATGVMMVIAAWLVGIPTRDGVAVAVAVIAGTLGVVAAYRLSAWMLAVVWRLDRSRQTEAQLAVAEERLRFARDLHDVVGRNLSVVAVKSELAAQLAKRGRAEAVDEMLAVRRIAQESLDELREVVRGYRTADLDSELAGARSVLASAGVECRVIGDGAGLSSALQGALGWAVREGITNVLRHSEASSCTVTLRSGADTVQLAMENDGVLNSNAGEPGGSGLVGLTERLAALGGTVRAESLPGRRFRLSVELPR